MIRYIILALSALLLGACANNPDSKKSAGIINAEQRDTATYSLPLPALPPTLTKPEERAAYVAARFWESMDWNDTLLLSSERFMGESMANFGMLLSLIPADKQVISINTAVKAAAENARALEVFSDYAFNYFYYPDAPQYDAELYLRFIGPLLEQENLDEAERLRIEDSRRDIMKNRVGSRVADFSYIGSDGNRHTLHSTATASDVRILFLYDPDCDACEQAVEIMKTSDSFNAAQKNGQTTVIAINAFGQKGGGAAKRKPSFPSEWIAGYSPEGEIEEKEIFAIRATPTIYILDRNSVILEKDLSLDRLSFLIHTP